MSRTGWEALETKNLVKKCKKVILCKKHKVKPTFKKQITRKDVLENLLNNLHLTDEELFDLCELSSNDKNEIDTCIKNKRNNL